METIGAFEARTHFGEILDRVERGESVAVLRKGRHIATIVPAESEPDAVEQAFERVLARRERLQREGRGLSLEEIIEARNEGRK